MAFCQKCSTIYEGTFHYCAPQPYVFNLPPQYEAQNDLVAVEPFKTDAVEKEIKGGFATAKQKVELKPLKVVFGTDKLPAGATVYVRGDLCVEADAKRVYEIDGQKVIFIKVSEVKLLKRYEQTQEELVAQLKAQWNKGVAIGVGG